MSNSIRTCQKQFPLSEARTLPDFDLKVLTKDDKCYLLCIMTAQKLVIFLIDWPISLAWFKNRISYIQSNVLQIYNGVFNVDALEFTSNNPKIATKFRTQCSSIRNADKCEFAAQLQKCIEEVIRKTPTSHFPPS